MSSNDRFLKMKKILLPLLILLTGALITVAMIRLRSAPEKLEQPGRGVLVETMTVRLADHQVQVFGTGIVQPSREVTLTSQVGGKVVEVADNLVAGGFFQKDQFMFRLEDEDYVLAVEQARAGVAQAELTLATTQSRAKIARKEWRNLEKTEEQPHPLVVYEPQLKEAEARLAAAGATLEQALLNLKRTEVRAPFNCRVRSESIDLGRVVKVGDSVALLADTDVAEIVIPLPVGELSWLKIPTAGSKEKGSPASVRLPVTEDSMAWKGLVARSLGEVDAESRMARVVVAVPEPYAPEHLLALVTGMFVEVVLAGKNLPEVIAIPRSALHDQATVWLMRPDNRLAISRVQVVRQEQDMIYIRDGVQTGDLLVLTNLAGAANGMLLRPMAEESKP
jgi:RND family efflux transporter MFP subunit